MKALLILFSSFAVAPGSVLSNAAALMNPGEFREVAAQNLNQSFGYTNGATGATTNYSEDLVWDPVDRRFYFLGSDHFYDGSSEYPRFLEYSESTNTWREMPRPTWFKAYPSADGEYALHGYDHSALDPATGYFYHRPFSGRRVIQQYLPAQQRWRIASYIPASFPDNVLACCIGIEFFPELPGLLLVDGKAGKVLTWSSKTGMWNELATGLPMGGYSNFTEYNPVHHFAVGGGGNGSSHLYKIDAAGLVTALKNAPFVLGILQSVFTVDPVSGDYLVLNASGGFYAYDAVSDKWSLIQNAPPIATDYGGNHVICVIATPVATYGVTAFVSCDPGSDCRMILYKHAASSDISQVPVLGRSSDDIHVAPHPFHSDIRISLRGIASGTVEIFSPAGKKVAQGTLNHAGACVSF